MAGESSPRSNRRPGSSRTPDRLRNPAPGDRCRRLPGQQGLLCTHIDRRFNYRGNDDYAGLLRHADVSERGRRAAAEVPRWVEASIPSTRPNSTERLSAPLYRSDGSAVRHCEPDGSEYPLSLLPGGGRIVASCGPKDRTMCATSPKDGCTNPAGASEQPQSATRPFVSQAIGATLQVTPTPGTT